MTSVSDNAGTPAVLKDRRTTAASVWRLLKTAPFSAWFGMIVVAAYMICAVLAPWIAPHGEAEQFDKAYAPWKYAVAWPWDVWFKGIPWIKATDSPFWLGTDQIGRDMLSRLIYGARNTIGIALATALLSFFIGGTLGMLAGYLRGWLDQILSRLVDALMSIPTLIFALLLMSIVLATYGPEYQTVMMVVIIATLDATRVFRLSRALTMNVSVMDYVEAASLRGETIAWVIFREILPNIAPPMILEFGLRFCFVFLTISSLGFLGVGIQPPAADWGSMVAENATLITYGNITPLLPAGAIALLTIAVNFVVDWFLHKTSGLKDEV